MRAPPSQAPGRIYGKNVLFASTPTPLNKSRGLYSCDPFVIHISRWRHVGRPLHHTITGLGPNSTIHTRLRSYQTQSAVSHSELRSQHVLGLLSTGVGDQPGTAW